MCTPAAPLRIGLAVRAPVAPGPNARKVLVAPSPSRADRRDQADRNDCVVVAHCHRAGRRIAHQKVSRVDCARAAGGARDRVAFDPLHVQSAASLGQVAGQSPSCARVASLLLSAARAPGRQRLEPDARTSANVAVSGVTARLVRVSTLVTVTLLALGSLTVR